MDSQINYNELLNYALQNDIINISTIQAQIEMNERTKILKEHKFSVWEDKDGYWHSYIPTTTGRKKLKKRNKEDLEDVIVDYYKSLKVKGNIFKDRWVVWIERQRNCGRSENTISKYQSDYNRFIKGYFIENRNVKTIDSECIGRYLLELLKDKLVPVRALKSLYGYLNGVFQKCIIDGIINDNPCKYIDLPVYFKYCTNRQRDASRRVLENEECEKVIKNIEKEQDNVPGLLIELSLCTGMRVGEIAGLKWSDIDYDNKVINIVRSEKYDRATKQYFISGTKTGKSRQFPLIKQADSILHRIMNVQANQNCLGEYIASDENGKINAGRISKYGERLTKTDKCKKGYSIHAIRRTVNSNLRHNGVSAVAAASLLGHSEKVNELNYTVDVSSRSEKYNYAEQASLIPV